MKAMVMAAGRGERMRPLTDHTPKPLVEVAGRPLIVHVLERLKRAGFHDIVVNHAWLGDRIVAALGDGSCFGLRITWSPEPNGALEVGGGIRHALPLLGEAPFLALNADVWCDYPLERLRLAPAGVAHLLLVDNPPHHREGDFHLRDGLVVPDGRSSLTFSGIGVYRPALFLGDLPDRFPLTTVLRPAVAGGEVSGERHAGRWFDVGSLARLEALNALLREPSG